MIKRVLATLVLFVASVVGWEITRALPPLAGLAWAVMVGTLFVWWHVRPGPTQAERLALARITRPIGAPRWAWLAVPATIAVIFGVSGFIESGNPPWPESEFVAYLVDFDTTFVGWIAVGIWMIGVAPIIGEFTIRGYVQGGLEKRWSPLLAILPVPAVATALLLIAPVPWALAVFLGFASAATGFVAYRFQSIWPAVGVTAGSALLYFILPFIHGDRVSNFGGLAPTYLIPLSSSLVLAGLVAWYVILGNTKGPGPSVPDGTPRGENLAKAHTGA